MKFSEGLLRARGQIAFLLALACSMAVIIYLETLNTSERIRAQVVAEAGMSGQSLEPRSDNLTVAVRLAIDNNRVAFTDDPGAPTNRAGMLNAAVLGLAFGVGPAEVQKQEADAVLALIEAGNPQEVWALAPALGLLAATVPEFESRVLSLLGTSAE
ncbi:hypothetical protein [Devosia sp. A449]